MKSASPSAGAPLAQPGSQTCGALAVQLADPGFADPQYLADFLQIQFFVVIQRQDQAFALRQLGDGVGQRRLESLVLQAVQGPAVTAADILVQAAMLAVLHQVVEAEQAAAQSVAKDAVVILETQLEFCRNLLIFSVSSAT